MVAWRGSLADGVFEGVFLGVNSYLFRCRLAIVTPQGRWAVICDQWNRSGDTWYYALTMWGNSLFAGELSTGRCSSASWVLLEGCIATPRPANATGMANGNLQLCPTGKAHECKGPETGQKCVCAAGALTDVPMQRRDGRV